jgi:hypothetical protein
MLLQFRNLIVGVFFIYLSVIGLIGCYTQPGTPEELNKISYRHHLGKATSFGFQEISRQTLSKYGYTIDRYDNRSSYLTIETIWKLRQPTTSEIVNGFTNSRTQLIISANLERSATSKFTADLFNCSMEIKNMVYNGSDWVEYYNSPELKSIINKIAKDLKDEFLLNMRQF